MKKLLLLGPLLWIRKVIISLLVLGVFVGVTLYFLANSPWVIQKAVDSFAPDYNIRYTHIHGNVLTGVEIEDLTYANHSLAKHITLKWNPNGLFQKKIIVNHLLIHQLHIDTLKALTKRFASEENSTTEPFALALHIKKSAIDIEAFNEAGVAIKSVVLHTDNIDYTPHGISVKRVKLMVDSNVSHIALDARIAKGIVDIDNMQIEKVDSLALEHLFLLEDKKKREEKQVHQQSNLFDNPLMPHSVVIHHLRTQFLPREYAPVKLTDFTLDLKETYIDLQRVSIKEGWVELHALSNLSTLGYKGKFKDNKLFGKVDFIPKEALFRYYQLPLRKEAIGAIDIDVNASKESIVAKIDTQMPQLLNVKKDAFNLDIDSLNTLLHYSVKKGILEANTTVRLSTPYGKDIHIDNHLTVDKTLSYQGEVYLAEVIGLDAHYAKLLNNMKLHYLGDTKGAKVSIDSEMLTGTLKTAEFQSAEVHLKSKSPLLLNQFVALPSELTRSQIDVLQVDSNLSFESNRSKQIEIKLHSNLVDMDANVSYKERLHILSLVRIPKESLLRAYSKTLKWDALNPMLVKATLSDNLWDMHLKAESLTANATYDINTTKVKGELSLGGFVATISGIKEKQMVITSQIASIPSLFKSIGEIYTLKEMPKVEGSATLSVEIDKLKTATLQLKAPDITYHADHKTVHHINNIDFFLELTDKKVLLKHYTLSYDKEKIYATKPSEISKEDTRIRINTLWLNDQLKVTGIYDMKTQKGKLVTSAQKMHLSHEIIDLDTTLDVTTLLDHNKTDIKGKILLWGGDIHYDLKQKSFASDSDIVIVQDIQKEHESPFMDNLGIDLQIETKKPLVYRKDNINIEAQASITVNKVPHADILVLGSVTLLEGGTYIFQNKKFVLKKSYIYFTGNPNKPMLDIEVQYKSLHHLVTISMTGSADMPNIRFSSKPSLTKEQILSLILFDSEQAAGTNSGDEMMKMMGGAMAKSALNDIGLKIDHLVLGAGNSIEVGKKLTNKITIIYVNDIVSGVKLTYQHGKHTQSVIGANETSQSYDIVYKQDF